MQFYSSNTHRLHALDPPFTIFKVLTTTSFIPFKTPPRLLFRFTTSSTSFSKSFFNILWTSHPLSYSLFGGINIFLFWTDQPFLPALSLIDSGLITYSLYSYPRPLPQFTAWLKSESRAHAALRLKKRRGVRIRRCRDLRLESYKRGGGAGERRILTIRRSTKGSGKG